MEQQSKLKVNMSTYHRLNIQHKINENILKQKHQLNLQSFKYREELFYKKKNCLTNNIQPYIHNPQPLTPSNNIRYKKPQTINISSQIPTINKSNKQIPFYQRYSSLIYLNQSNFNEEKYFQRYLNQEIFNEYKNQLKNNERKNILLKQFDELKHTINDPHSTLSALAALSRAFLYSDSGKK